MDTYPDMLVAVHFYKSGLQPTHPHLDYNQIVLTPKRRFFLEFRILFCFFCFCSYSIWHCCLLLAAVAVCYTGEGTELA